MQESDTAVKRLGVFLRERRKRFGWKLEAVAKRSGLVASYVSRIERGEEAGRTKLPPMETIDKLAEGYQVASAFLQTILAEGEQAPAPLPRTVEELLEQARMVAPIAIPVVEHPAHAGHSGSAVVDYVYVDRPFAVNKELVCIPIKGNCMGPRIQEGDRVIVERDRWPTQGEMVVAVVNEEIYLRRFFQSNGEIRLRADNPEYHEIAAKEADIIGVVVEVTWRP